MADSVNKILSGGFVGLGEVFSKNVAPAFTQFQNSLTPNPRPVNDNNFSFNFAGAVQSLLRPFQKVTDPAAAAKTDIINSLGNAASGIIGAAGNKAVDLIKNGNKKPATVTTTGLDILNPLPSQTGGASLGDLLSFIYGSRPANAAITASPSATIAVDAANAARNSIFLVGGAALLLMFLATSKGK